MVNSFPTNVKARRKGCFFFLNTEELEDFSETGLGFQKIPYGIICSRALAAPCVLRENLCCQRVPFIVRIVHTTYLTQ